MFQPLVNLQDHAICSFEALLRWDHPVRGLIRPVEFIPIAEQTGAIVAIGEWVLRKACLAAVAWPDDIRVAVNLSPAQFKSGHLVEQVVSALKGSGLAARRLKLEITESLLLAETQLTLETLHALRKLDVRIAMDDFGTGYSSLSYLRSFPFDKSKIDRSFVRDLASQANSHFHYLGRLGQSLGMSSTAEGVKTQEQLDIVRAQGCNEVQRYLFSVPLSADGAEAFKPVRADDVGAGSPLRRARASHRAPR